MNDIIAKKVNDTYLIRCAQILNNKSRIVRKSHITKDGKERIIFLLSADGIKTSKGEIIPYVDGFNTIGFYRNNKSITVFLLGTDYKIDLYATSEKCYFRNKSLQIELKYENTFLNETMNTEKNYFQFKGPKSTISTTYALNQADILEIIYFYEQRIDNDDGQVENSIINTSLLNRSDSEISDYMEMLYQAYMDNDPGESEEEEKEIPAKPEDVENLPDEIKTLIEKSKVFDEQKVKDLTSNESQVNNSIFASTFRLEQTGEMVRLKACTHDLYIDFYEELAEENVEDYFVVSDIFGNPIDTRDSELEDIDDDEYEVYDDDELDNNIDDEEKLYIDRFEMYRKEDDDEQVEQIDISDAKKENIIKATTEYVILKDFEFSDLFGLIYPMIGVFNEIENEFSKYIESKENENKVNKDLSDNW